AESANPSATLLPARPAPAESVQQSHRLSRSPSADLAPPGCQSAQICPQYEPSGMTSPEPVPQ
ncbi:hypothetical protein Tco_1281337, partial [Tanacetum coccineum]